VGKHGATGYPELVTIGVEEEFLLVDPATRRTADGAVVVLKQAGALPVGAALHSELLTTQVEFATGVCTSLDELRAQLTAGRQALRDAAQHEGLSLVSSGTAVLSEPDVPVTPGERFERITGLYAQLLTDYEVSGCHVHVGVADRETAVAVINHLSVWLPVLLALSANSPFHHGRDTGYASWRMVQQSRLPGSGLTPWFRDSAEYDRTVARLVELGVLADDTMTFWLARPSPRYSTVEVRVADAVATVDEAVLQAGLTEALVRYALTELKVGREAEPVPPQWGAAAVWSAARYGLAGPGVDLRTGRRMPMMNLLGDLVDLVAPGSRTAVRAVVDRGTGVTQQRRAGSPAAAVDELSELL
jgi:glutamate---cysteine ligase / carboxylate-amine ligase